jgi:hypothetical protein
MITVDSKPNFSLLAKDEICLDSLSIRELQEVFHATFGRQTNVKDKSWLKRRITMGLTNSCQVPTSNFVIKDKKIVPKEGGAQHEVTTYGSCEAQSPHESAKKRMRTSISNFESSANLDDGSTAKRMRKPTKRYIEELSSLDNRDESMRSTSWVGRNNHDQLVRSRVRPNREIGSWQTAFRTRNDSLGGFQVQVPFTSRARRCRPRKNLVAFMVTIYSALITPYKFFFLVIGCKDWNMYLPLSPPICLYVPAPFNWTLFIGAQFNFCQMFCSIPSSVL